jgi:hypothetical protein
MVSYVVSCHLGAELSPQNCMNQNLSNIISRQIRSFIRRLSFSSCDQATPPKCAIQMYYCVELSVCSAESSLLDAMDGRSWHKSLYVQPVVATSDFSSSFVVAFNSIGFLVSALPGCTKINLCSNVAPFNAL